MIRCARHLSDFNAADHH